MNKLNILVLSTAGHRALQAKTMFDYLYSFNLYSEHNYYYHSFFDLITEDFDFSLYDAIVLFYNFNYSAVPDSICEKIKKSQALKILFFQDEYSDVCARQSFMAKIEVDLMFTCVAERDFDLFYPKSKIPSMKGIYTVLTGYVSESLATRRVNWGAKREYDIGYRSRAVPYMLGDLGREKVIIAERFSNECKKRKLKYNISIKEKDRIYAEQWYQFLENSRCQLGTESGCSIVDFSGNLIDTELNERIKNKHLSYNDFHVKCLLDVEGASTIKAISPRIFDYAACGAVPILFEGQYSNILSPHDNYIMLKKDFSNLSDVMEKALDQDSCFDIAKKNHRDLIVSRKYSYKNFIVLFDSILKEHCTKTKNINISKARFYIDRACIDGQARIPFQGGHLVLPISRNGLKEIVGLVASRMAHALPVIGSELRKVGGDALYRISVAASAIFLGKRIKLTEIEPNLMRRKFVSNFSQGYYLQWLHEVFLLCCFGNILKNTHVDSRKKYEVQYFYESANSYLTISLRKHSKGSVFLIDSELVKEDVFFIKLKHISSKVRINRVLLDLAEEFTIQRFCVAIIFSLKCFIKNVDLRSEHDEYFHMEHFADYIKKYPSNGIDILQKITSLDSEVYDEAFYALGNARHS
jgi:hypothetical protein